MRLSLDLDSNLLFFLNAYKKHSKKEELSQSEFINEMLAYAMMKKLGLDEKN